MPELKHQEVYCPKENESHTVGWIIQHGKYNKNHHACQTCSNCSKCSEGHASSMVGWHSMTT